MTETVSVHPTADHLKTLGTELADAVFGFRRVTRRVVRQSFPGDPLPPSEAELLAFVRRSKGTGVGEAAQALQLWLNSPEHRANLMNPRWREIGIAAVHATAAPGVFHGLDVTIVTTDFGSRH